MNNFRNFISSKLFIFGGSLFLIFMAVIVFNQWNQKRQVNKEIGDLNLQAKNLSQKNGDLQNLISYLQTDDYKQRAARQQLNLKRSGEQVFSFSTNNVLNDNSDPTANAADQNGSSNPQKWW